MEGICPNCSRPKVVALHEGLCYYHRSKADKALKSLKPISNKSEVQKGRDKVYNTINAAFKAEHPLCQAQLEGCQKLTVDTHHKKGKVGQLLTDKKYFLACCRHCHTFIENNPVLAKALGLSISRLTKTDTQS